MNVSLGFCFVRASAWGLRFVAPLVEAATGCRKPLHEEMWSSVNSMLLR